MASGLLLVGWAAVKAGLGLYSVQRAIADPVGAADEAARGVLLAGKRSELAMLEKRLRETRSNPNMRTGYAREGSLAQRLMGAPTLEDEVARLEAEVEAGRVELVALREEDEAAAADAPGISTLKRLDAFLGEYGPVGPAAVTGANILLEVLRVRRERRLINGN